MKLFRLGVLTAFVVLQLGMATRLWADPPINRAPFALPPVINPDSRFGIAFVNGVTPDSNAPYNDPYANPTTRYEWARKSGARWTRWPLYWHRIEAIGGAPNYAAQDQVVEGDLRSGLQVNAILEGTPDWAATSLATGAGGAGATTSSSTQRPLDLRLTASGVTSAPRGVEVWPLLPNGQFDQQTPNVWARFVYQTVLRYKDWGKRWGEPEVGVKVWEIWNEPDFIYWHAGPERYWQLLRSAYVAAKAADPSATVLFGGLAYFANPAFLQQVLTAIAADPRAPAYNYYFDALPVHLYVNPRNLLYVTAALRAELAARRLSKPIWVNEAGIAVCEDTLANPTRWCDNHGRGTLNEQADYMIQAFALAAVAGIDRLFVFQLYDDDTRSCNGPDAECREWFGLLRNLATGEVDRPAYTAYQVAATYLSRATGASRNLQGDAELVTLTGMPLGKVTALWNWGKNPTAASIPATAQRAKLVTRLGISQPLTPVGGVYTITLPPATHLDCINNSCRNDQERQQAPIDLGSEPKLLVETVASFDGRVTDTRNLGLANATVTLRNLGTGETTTTMSAPGGAYHVEAYDLGSYEIGAAAPGFDPLPGRAVVRDWAGSFPQTFALPQPGNGVRNGGFEEASASDWQISLSGTMTATVSQTFSHTGSRAFKLGYEAGFGEASLMQTGIALTSGISNPTLSFMYSTLGTPAEGERLTLEATPDSGQPIASDLPVRTSGWTLYSIRLDPATRNLSFRLAYRKPAASPARVFIDEVTVASAIADLRPVLTFPFASKAPQRVMSNE